MSFLLILLIVILAIVYTASAIALFEIFADNNISVNLWLILVMLLPIVNTIFVIKYNKKILNFFSIKIFLKEIKNLK